jgi:hypothetical protein
VFHLGFLTRVLHEFLIFLDFINLTILDEDYKLWMKSKGFWQWCVIICKSVFLDFVHHLYFSKITFQNLDHLPSSGKIGRILPEDGRRSSFWNVILLKYWWWTKSKKPLLQTNYEVHIVLFSPLPVNYHFLLSICSKYFLFLNVLNICVFLML